MDCWPLYIDSLISLERFCSSLPTMLKFSSKVIWPVVLPWSWIGEGAFRCSLNLSPNVLDVSPMYSSSHSHSNLSHLNQKIIPLFFVMWSLSFGATNSSFRVFPLLKCTCIPYLVQIFLKLSLRPLLYGTVMKLLLMVLVLVPLLLFLAVLGVLFFNFILLMAHAGYLQAGKTLFMCACSSSSWSWLEQISLALCSSELITLYLLDMAWWLSHCKYWLVWVSFLYTVVDRLWSLFGVTKVSRKGMDPSALVVSAVNSIFSSKELMWFFHLPHHHNSYNN